jgi:hypothetical protein
MEKFQSFKEWRSEEVAKLNLLKSSYNFNIERFPTPVFDFFITLNSNKKVKFAVEVKEANSFKNYIKNHISKLKIYRENGMINIPALIIKVNEVTETGEIDFLIIPSKTGKLLIRQNFDFKELNPLTIDVFIKKIEDWWINK